MFEYFQFIVFQLVERIAFIKKPLREAYGTDMLGFAYPALCTRHEVHGKPYLQEEYNIIRTNPQNYNIADMARINSKIQIQIMAAADGLSAAHKSKGW